MFLSTGSNEYLRDLSSKADGTSNPHEHGETLDFPVHMEVLGRNCIADHKAFDYSGATY